jgi:peptidoglycan hydrolase CwlO-like protein
MPVKKFFLLILSVVLAVGMLFYSPPAPTVADELDDINRELAKLTDDLNKSVAATKPLEGQLDSMKRQIESIKQQIVNVESGIVVKKKEIDDGYKRLSEKEKLIARTIREFYVTSYYDSPLLTFLSLDNAFDITQVLAYQRAKTRQDKIIITNIALSLVDLERKKADLEREQKTLAVAKVSLDEQSTKLDQIVKGAKNYQGDLSGKIAALSAQQQSLLAAKSGNFSVSVGNATADDYNASLGGWSASAPSGSITVFSFGAYAGNGSNYRRNGMSQWGALGRIKANPNLSYEELLQIYYPGSKLVDYPVMGNITVDGHGSMPFEDKYLKNIWEVPESWPMAVLKAQAVAARTYAVRVTNNGQSSICPSDRCQVYQSNEKPAPWPQAVSETRGKILVDSNNNPVSTQYVSTPGGYLDTKGWDTTCGNQSCLADGAYDRESPWFYKAWYTNYKYPQGMSSCKRTNPWLSQSDISDILNAWIVYTSGSGEAGRILPPDGCGGGNPYSVDEMRQKAGGDAVSSVSGVSVSQSSNGITSSVNFQTNKGSINIPGFDTGCAHASENCRDFWTIFNLRAPGNISIKNRMFDVRLK